jgi:hypothetical protein
MATAKRSTNVPWSRHHIDGILRFNDDFFGATRRLPPLLSPACHQGVMALVSSAQALPCSGFSLGLGLLAKHAMIYFPLVGLAALLDQNVRKLLRQRELWIALATGAALISPNLL